MAATKIAGTRERESVLEFLHQASTLRSTLVPHIEPGRFPSALPFHDIWVAAVASCGTSEIYARSLDRSLALDVGAGERTHLEAEVARYNERGIAAIEQIRDLMPRFREELGTLDAPDPEILNQGLADLESEVKAALAETDMKGSDAEKLMMRFVDAGNVIRESGLTGVPDHIDRMLQELLNARRSDDRGSSENIPVWKVYIIAAAAGWWLTIMLICFVYGAVLGLSCPPAWYLVWAIIAVSHFIAFIVFC
jgi:hypothetical protein